MGETEKLWKSLIGLVIVVVYILIFFSPVFGEENGRRFDPGYNPHEFVNDRDLCTRCHYVNRNGVMEEDVFSTNLADFCHECHPPEDLGRSHPIGIDPTEVYWRLRLPDDFYLDYDHKMTCITCHESHGKYLSTEKMFPFQEPVNPDAKKYGEPYYYKTYFVRRSDPEKGYAVLCNECHEGYL